MASRPWPVRSVTYWGAVVVLTGLILALNAAGYSYLLSDITRIASVATTFRSAGFLLPAWPGQVRVTRPLGLPIDNATLEQVYAEALREARRVDPEARLSQVGVTLVPFEAPPAIAMVLTLYARPWGHDFDTYKGRVLEYHWSPDRGGKLAFAGELTEPKPEVQAPFQEPPWRRQGRWPEFVERAVRIARLSRHPLTTIHLFQYGNDPAHNWSLLLHDGARKQDRQFYLRGSQILEDPDPFLRADLDILARVFVSAEYLGPRQVLLENSGGGLRSRIEAGRFPDLVGPGTIHGVVLVPVSPGRVDAIVHVMGYDGAPYFERLRLEVQSGKRWKVVDLRRQFI